MVKYKDGHWPFIIYPVWVSTRVLKENKTKKKYLPRVLQLSQVELMGCPWVGTLSSQFSGFCTWLKFCDLRSTVASTCGLRGASCVFFSGDCHLRFSLEGALGLQMKHGQFGGSSTSASYQSPSAAPPSTVGWRAFIRCVRVSACVCGYWHQ